MKVKFYVILAVALMTASCLFAETEIVLHEVIEVGFIAGDSPLDDPGQEGTTPMQPYGNVTIESGGNVEINVGDKVVIKKDFEVKQGGQLLIH